VYRRTLKHLRPVHVIMHRLMNSAVIPLLERTRGFRTMPDDPLWFRLELLTNRHEVETLAQVRRVVGPGMTVLDVGAHVGYYARHCARLVGTEGRVIAFEPHPRTFSVLSTNVGTLANVTPVQMALAEAEGTAELYDYLMMSASGSLHYDPAMRDFQKAQLSVTDIAPRIAEDFPVQKYTVRTVAIDDYLAENGIERVDVVKMDIEGAEVGALRGMTRTIQNSDRLALVVEYNPHALEAFGLDPEAALFEIQDMGFDRMQIIEADGSLKPITGDRQATAQLTDRLMPNMGVVNMLFTRGY
jgi:FkbM family methyltransferase